MENEILRAHSEKLPPSNASLKKTIENLKTLDHQLEKKTKSIKSFTPN